MEVEFLPNNSHLDSPGDFAKSDPHLRRMAQNPYIFQSPIIKQLPADIPGIYNLGGGRQIGKTTLLKQWMLHLLATGVAPEAIVFLSCELIVDEQSLYRIVSQQLNTMPEQGLLYLILDEITYVANWDKAIKYLADTGLFDNVVVVISGSDLAMMQAARMRFPGRRGKADQVDFHYYPLSFQQVLQLKGHFSGELPALTEDFADILFTEFENYLIHGGFLTAINEYATTATISQSTLATYSDWIRGDVIKHGKNEHYLREILTAIIKHYSSQVSWRNLVGALSIDHTQTAIDYVELLTSMDTVYVQAALIEDKLVAAPKKPRKFMFCDPFILHAITAWLTPHKDPFAEHIIPAVTESIQSAKLVEAIVVNHFQRHYPTYYIKAESEVDVAYVDNGKFWPIEVKWTKQLRPNDLKQISKYPNGKIWAKTKQARELNDLPVIPLPYGLAELG
ncbi:MAG: ATPase [Legionellales bacterium]|nr:ATPase [Legionellales bacterium]